MIGGSENRKLPLCGITDTISPLSWTDSVVPWGPLNEDDEEDEMEDTVSDSLARQQQSLQTFDGIRYSTTENLYMSAYQLAQDIV